MGALIGFMFGYVVGTKAGPEGLEELRKAWDVVSRSDEFQGLVAAATAYAQSLLAQGGASLAGQMQAMASGNGDLLKMVGAVDEGGFGAAWSRISESQEFRALLASGSAMIGNLLVQGTAAAARQSAQGH
jgi:hypothetical protein